MELNHLKYFYFVAKEGGFSKAARALKIAQPAVTKMVKNLEGDLGVPLFDRLGKTVRLTKAGNDLYRKCELIFGHIDDIMRNQRKPSGVVSGTLCIAAAEPIANHLLTGPISQLVKSHPQLYPQVISGTATEMCRRASAGKVDVALLFHAPDLPDNLEVIGTYTVPFKLVVAKDKQSDSSVCSSFIGSREVDDVGNRKYPTLNKLQKVFPKAEIRLSANAISSHLPLVLAGVGVSILPEFLVKKHIAAGRLATLLEDEDFRFNIKVVTRRGIPLTEATKEFLTLTAKALGQ